MRFDIITIFPKIFSSRGGSPPASDFGRAGASGGDSSCYFEVSLFKRAQKNKIVEIHAHDLRAFTTDKHHKVDDSPYGGGPGMVFKFEPIAKAVSGIKRGKNKTKTRVILFSTRGKKLDEKVVQRLSKYDQLIFICGRYEGVDERVAKYIADEEISIGDYIVSGGELPAMVVIDAISRKLKGFLGKHGSLEEIKGSYPVYTRPALVKFGKKNIAVPKILQHGHHQKIEEWRNR